MDTPLDLRGRPRRDRALGVVAAVVSNYLGAVTRFGYDASPVGRVDPVLDLTVQSVSLGNADGDVVVLDLADRDGSDLPPWQPGCHIDVHLHDALRGEGLRRQYSLCGDPADRSVYRIAVRRIVSGRGSGHMHALRPGDRVATRGPRNAFPFAGEPSLLFVAGGIGITPILPMVRAARARGLDWHFVYAGRSRASMPFVDEIESWTKDSDRVVVRTDVDDGIPSSTDLLRSAPPGGAVYCCGPTPMLDAVRGGFAATGARALHFERFGPTPIIGGVPFEVQLLSTGTVLQVPADRSALSVIKDVVPSVAYSCQQGFCGTCKTRVLSGTPDHRERRLTDSERTDYMLTCVSRADNQRLVLDL